MNKAIKLEFANQKGYLLRITKKVRTNSEGRLYGAV